MLVDREDAPGASGREGRLPVRQSEGRPATQAPRLFDPIVARAALPDFTRHCLRHTFTGRLVVAEVDRRTVGELMGHSSIEMTKRYTHLSQREKELAVAHLEQRRTINGTSKPEISSTALTH